MVIPVILGAISALIYGFILSMLGMFAYPLLISLFILGIFLIQKREINAPKSVVATIFGIVFFVVLILQLATSSSIIDLTFSEYADKIFAVGASTRVLTAGGLLFGVIAYATCSSITVVGAYIAFLICALILIVVLVSLISSMTGENNIVNKIKNAVLSTDGNKTKFAKGYNIPMQLQPIKDTKLYVEEITPLTPQERMSMGGSMSQMSEPQRNVNSYPAGQNSYPAPQQIQQQASPSDAYTQHSQNDAGISKYEQEAIQRSEALSKLYGSKPIQRFDSYHSPNTSNDIASPSGFEPYRSLNATNDNSSTASFEPYHSPNPSNYTPSGRSYLTQDSAPKSNSDAFNFLYGERNSILSDVYNTPSATLSSTNTLPTVPTQTQTAPTVNQSQPLFQPSEQPKPPKNVLFSDTQNITPVPEIPQDQDHSKPAGRKVIDGDALQAEIELRNKLQAEHDRNITAQASQVSQPYISEAEKFAPLYNQQPQTFAPQPQAQPEPEIQVQQEQVVERVQPKPPITQTTSTTIIKTGYTEYNGFDTRKTSPVNVTKNLQKQKLEEEKVERERLELEKELEKMDISSKFDPYIKTTPDEEEVIDVTPKEKSFTEILDDKYKFLEPETPIKQEYNFGEGGPVKFTSNDEEVKNAVSEQKSFEDIVSPGDVDELEDEYVDAGDIDEYNDTGEYDNTDEHSYYNEVDDEYEEIIDVEEDDDENNFVTSDYPSTHDYMAEQPSIERSNSYDDYSEPSLMDSILDTVEDLSENKGEILDDSTGYYNIDIGDKRNSDDISFGAKVKRHEINTSSKVKLDPKNQVKMEDHLASVSRGAVDAPPPPKRKKRKYRYPSIDLLNPSPGIGIDGTDEGSQINAKIIEDTLASLKFKAKVKNITRGPAVTRYELEPEIGTKINKIQSFVADLSYNLAATNKIRIETPIPGKRAVGIEVSNKKVDLVCLRDIIDSRQFKNSTSPIALAIGKDISSVNIVCELDEMPHLLIAGTTGSGKSACLNSIIMSILYKSTPEEVRLILIDPKHVEFTMYENLPHLMTGDIITDAAQALNSFKWLHGEMERRYKLLGSHYVKKIDEYNALAEVKSGELERLPRIVMIIDELADLMMGNNKRDLEDKIKSITQKARAAGIHLILATQRPTVDVITGTIKANLPSRIAFAVKSVVDSRTILDESGAESLIGRGDMLYAPPNGQISRVQGAYVTNEEVAAVVDFVRDNNESDYSSEFLNAITVKEVVDESTADSEGGGAKIDQLMLDVLKTIITTQKASTSFLQRRFTIGYNRAARIVDQMEACGYIGPSDGSKSRQIFITKEQYEEIFQVPFEE